MNPHDKNQQGYKQLNPLFGAYCATQAFSDKAVSAGNRHVHVEAYLDDPSRQTWTVTKVVQKSDGTTVTSFAKAIREKTTFTEAVNILARFEKDCVASPELWAPLLPDADAMQFLHFRSFAEREGYVFDVDGVAHARANPHSLPLNVMFAEHDIVRANKNLQRPANEFDGAGPLAKAPNTHFLFDQFTRATHRQNLQLRMNELRVIDILDRFVTRIETAESKLRQYCEEYHETGKGALVGEAETALEFASHAVRQLRAYGFDTTHFDSFVTQCKITCCILNAQGLYSLMSEGVGAFDENEAAFRARVTQAVDMIKAIDNRPEAIETLQNMIVQSPKPAVPDSIGLFTRNYRRERAAYKSGQKPPAPKP